nr:hypothetical protein [candidate division Zixibacteria bacterium]
MTEYSPRLTIIVFSALIFILIAPLSRAENPDEVSSKIDRCRTLIDSDSLIEAIASLEELYHKDPGRMDIGDLLVKSCKFLGVKYYGQSLYTEAITAWKKALEIEPGNREILGYIARCEAEIIGLAKASGLDTTAAADQLPLTNQEITPVHTAEEPDTSESKTTAITENKPDSTTASKTIESGILNEDSTGYGIPRSHFSSGLETGLAARSDGADTRSSNGWYFNGFIELTPGQSRVALRFEVMYARLYHKGSMASDFSDEELLNISGGSLDATIINRLTKTSSLRFFAGPGVYEVDRIDHNSTETDEIIHSKTGLGLNLGIGWKKRFPSFAILTNIRYIYISPSISPNLLTLSFGLATL